VGYIGVVKSTDGGATWSYLDIDNSPEVDTFNNSGFFNYGRFHDTRTFAVCPHATELGVYLFAYRSLLFEQYGPYRVKSFDLNTETWVDTSDEGPLPDLNNGGDLMPGDDGFLGYQSCMAIGMSATTGIIYVVAVMSYDESTPPSSPPNIGARTYYATLTGGVTGVWSAAIRVPNQILNPAIGGNTPAGYWPVGVVSGSGGRVHALLALSPDVSFLDADKAPGLSYFLLDNGSGSPASDVVQLSSFREVWDFGGNGAGLQLAAFDNGGSTGLVFVFGKPDTFSTEMELFVMYCTDDTAPVWVETSVITLASDPPIPVWGCGNDTPDIVIFRYPNQDFYPTILYERTFASLTLGAESIIAQIDPPVANEGWYAQPTVSFVASVSSIFGTNTGTPGTATFPFLFQMAGLAGLVPPPPPEGTVITLPPYGARTIIKCPNYYDVCLYWEREAYRNMRQLRAAIPNPARNSAPRFPGSDIVVPWDGREFRRQGAIPLPTTEEENTLILQWRVPIGYDGVIWGLACLYTGSGYIEASEDLIFRLNINRIWPRDFGSINNTMGSLSSTFTFQEGIRVYSDQIISLFVYLGAGALTRLDPLARIIGAMDGWIYPRCKTQRKK